MSNQRDADKLQAVVGFGNVTVSITLKKALVDEQLERCR